MKLRQTPILFEAYHVYSTRFGSRVNGRGLDPIPYLAVFLKNRSNKLRYCFAVNWIRYLRTSWAIRNMSLELCFLTFCLPFPTCLDPHYDIGTCLSLHCCGSMKFWYGTYGSGSPDPYHWVTDPNPDPALFVNCFLKVFVPLTSACSTCQREKV